jgi:hypothetical protein
MARLAHPNVVTVFDFGEDAGQRYLAMEYVEGATLAAVIAARAPLPAAAALHVAAEIARGLEAIHTLNVDGAPHGLVHRDVTPGNVFLGRAGAVPLGDFGIATARGRAGMTARGHLKGTLAYMAPEQARGEEVDARADLYSLGLIVAEMLTGHRVLAGDTEAALLRAALDPPPLDEGALTAAAGPDGAVIVRRLLARHADGRFPRAGEVEAALRRVLAKRAPEVGAGAVSALVAAVAAGAPPAAEAGAPIMPGRSAAAPEEPPPAPSGVRATMVQPGPPPRPVAGRWVAAALAVALAGAGAAWIGMRRSTGPATVPAAAPAIVPATVPAAAPVAVPVPVPVPGSGSGSLPATAPGPAPALVPVPVRLPVPGSAPAPRRAPRPAPPSPPPSASPPAVVAPTPPTPDRRAVDLLRRRRGLAAGDAPRCDQAGRALPAAPEAPALERVLACYEAVRIDRAFLDAKLARVAARVAAAGRDRDPAVQRLSKRALERCVAGRFEEANAVLNELSAALP